MSCKLFRNFFFFLLLLTFCVSISSAIMAPVNLTQLVEGADEICIGTINNVTSQWNDDHSNIITTGTVSIQQDIKGGNSNKITSITVLGGTLEGITQWVEDQPMLISGSYGILFLKKDMKGVNYLYGANQGIISLNKDVSLSEKKNISLFSNSDEITTFIKTIVQKNNLDKIPLPHNVQQSGSSAIRINSVKPNIASAGTNTEITITGSGFATKANRESLADVIFFFQTDGEIFYNFYASGWPKYSSNLNDIVSWTDSRIIVRVPSGISYDSPNSLYSGSASSGYVRILKDDESLSDPIPFTVTFGYGKKKWTKSAQYYINPNFRGLNIQIPIQEAAATWNREIPNANFKIQYAGSSSKAKFGNDGTSLIFLGPSSDFVTEPNVIAWATSWTDSSGSIIESDIEFNPKWQWTTGTATGDQMNVQAITLHEMGHWLRLTDLYGLLPQFGYSGYPSDIGKIMLGINDANYGNQNQIALHSSDILGIRWIYPSTSNPVPKITSLTPSSVTVGSPDLILSISGSNFLSSSVIRWNGMDRTTTYQDSTTLTALILSSYLINQGTSTVTVYNPSPGGGTSNAISFSITESQGDSPRISSISPSSVVAGGQGFTLTIQGEKFTAGSIVQWNQEEKATTFISEMTLTAKITATDISHSGNAVISVKTPDGLVSNQVAFKITNEPSGAFRIISLSPREVVAKSSSILLNVTGEGFDSGSSLHIDGTKYSSSSISPTSISLQVPTWLLAVPAIHTIAVKKSGQDGEVSNFLPFLVTQPLDYGYLKSNFVASPTAGSSPLPVTFLDLSTGGATEYLWNFGDGTTSYEKNPTHEYKVPGSYSVTLTINKNKKNAQLIRKNFITVKTGPSPTPTPTIIPTPTPTQSPTPTPTPSPDDPYLDIQQTVTSVTQAVDKDGTFSLLTIKNNGGVDLSYTITEEIPWLTLTQGGSATLTPGKSNVVKIQVDTRGLVKSHRYWGVLTINHNDPNEDTVPVNIRLQVV
jgi:PKD repeat protein